MKKNKPACAFHRDPIASDESWKDLFLIRPLESAEKGKALQLAWKVFCDYDYSEKTYTLTYNPLNFLRQGLTQDAYTLVANREVSNVAYDMDPYVYKKDKKMHYWTIGLSFMVNL